MLEGADYVLCTIRQGGLAAFQTDIDIPLKYGVDQCVGDTLCAGGIMFAQRTIPALLEICNDISEVAKPAIVPQLLKPDGDECLGVQQLWRRENMGFCHGVQGATGRSPAASKSGQEERAAQGRRDVHRRDVDIIAAGINHQTWFIKSSGAASNHPLMPEFFEMHPAYPTDRKSPHRRSASFWLLHH